MAIIAFVSQKGGVGKSTLARALGREAAKSGLSIKIADLDPGQGTTTEWMRIRTAAGIEPMVPVQLYRAAAEALGEAERHDLLIIDGPAKTSAATLDIAKVADLVVQPTGNFMPWSKRASRRIGSGSPWSGSAPTPRKRIAGRSSPRPAMWSCPAAYRSDRPIA
jgi:cellulose biosynthesis protein BcsQ